MMGLNSDQVILKVYDAVEKALKVNVVKTVGGGGGSSGSLFQTGSDSFGSPDNGTIVDTSTNPSKSYGIQVKKSGTVSQWSVDLEGSIDGVNFEQILTHDSTDNADGSIVWSGTVESPCLYFRARCVSFTGSGTITVTTLGVGTLILEAGSTAPFGTSSDVYVATGSGAIVDAHLNPAKYFGLQVKKLGAVTSWTVVLQGSLDGVNFETIMTHDSSTDADGNLRWSGVLSSPCLYYKSKATAISLGAGTNVTATIVGML